MSHTPPTGPYDSTVEQLYNVAHDIEMQDAFPKHEMFYYLIIDTNVLIDYKTIIELFCHDVEQAKLPIKLIIPSVVLGELDGMKKNKRDEGLQWFARQATTWLLAKIKERTTVKIQSAKETLSPSGAPPAAADETRQNDLAIRDCGLYFNDKTRGRGACMVSMDQIHIVACHAEGIPCYQPPQQGWSSRELAKALNVPDWQQFHDRSLHPRYRPRLGRMDKASGGGRLGRTEGPPDAGATAPVADEDSMDVDLAPGPASEEYIPVHARDALHVQIAEHFTLVLRELAADVHAQHGESTAVAVSAHAPAHRRVPLERWTAGTCLEYLAVKKHLTRYEGAPWMPAFFASRRERGWRKGQDWSARMWEMAMDMLEEVGKKFGDGRLLSSVAAVRPHVREAWESKVRPL